jgi:hypothetical protein
LIVTLAAPRSNVTDPRRSSIVILVAMSRAYGSIGALTIPPTKSAGAGAATGRPSMSTVTTGGPITGRSLSCGG